MWILIVSIIFFAGWLLWRWSSRRYTLPCPAWLSWLVELDNPFTTINRAATIIHHADLARGMKVIDIGCGPGRITIPLAQAVGPNGSVVAMDMQVAMLDKVREKVINQKIENISLLEAAIGAGKLPQNYFDRAILVTVLGEIPEQEKAMAEIFSALKPGGILSITEIVFDPHFQRYSNVLSLAKNAGFTEKEFFGHWYAYTLHVQKPG